MRTKLGAIAAGAALTVIVPSAAQAVVVAEWKMDEPSGATTMVDSAGGDNNGRIGSVVTGVQGLAGGSAYQFDGATSYIEVPDKANLDPGTKAITIGATVKVEDGEILDDSYEVIRKGIVTTKGGEWKMEIKRAGSDSTVGRLNCVFKGVLSNGTTSLASKLANPDVVDGQAHRLECKKTGTSISAVVDGQAFPLTKTVGKIVNAEPVVIGSKVAGDDVMQGIIDQVTVNIG